MLALVGVLVATALAWRDVLGLPLVGEDYAIFARMRAGGTAYEHLFRPLSALWLRALYAAFGAGSGVPFHAAITALHAVNAMLVFALALGLFRRPMPGFVAALAFAVGAGATDSLAWVASASRPVSACAMLIAANGLVRLESSRGERRRAPGMVAPGPVVIGMVVIGLALQASANEDIYGTAALAAVWLGFHAVRSSGARRRSTVLGLAALVVATGLLYRFFGRVPDSADGIVATGLRAAPFNALERSSDVWAGLGAAFPGAGVLPFALVLPLVVARRIEAAAFALLAWLASFIPFALDDPVPYRAYSTLAPNALVLAGAVHGLALLASARRAEPVLGVAAAAAVLLGAAGPRAERLEFWRDSTREIAAVEPLVRARARTPAEPAPVLVNLETSTLVMVAYVLSVDDPGSLVTLDFFDAVGACVPPDAMPPRPWFGRRLDGSYGEIDPAAYFSERVALTELALVGKLAPARDLEDARSLLADPAIDHASTSVAEISPAELAALGARGSAGTIAVLEPLTGDLVAGWGRMRVGIDAGEPTVLAVRHGFQYWHRMRFTPDQRIYSDVRHVRALRLAARIDGGEPVDAFFLDAFGFGVPVPAGAHELELQWRRATVAELR